MCALRVFWSAVLPPSRCSRPEMFFLSLLAHVALAAIFSHTAPLFLLPLSYVLLFSLRVLLSPYFPS